jgi:hypothetical protein
LYRSPERHQLTEAKDRMSKLFANSGQAGRKIKRLLNENLLQSESAGTLPTLKTVKTRNSTEIELIKTNSCRQLLPRS